jgi:hypothetical protein
VIAKYNPFHKPRGPGGGQFASGPQAGSSSAPRAGFHQVAQDMHVRLDSTYKPGVPGNEDIDIAHAVVTDMIYSAILTIGNAGFRPGMPDYGLLLHLALAAQLKLKGDPWLNSGLIYLNGNRVLGNSIPFGASVPDVVYGPPGHPLARISHCGHVEVVWDRVSSSDFGGLVVLG